MKEFMNALFQTAENAGLKVISDEHAAKLLAWTYAYGGGVENVVLDAKMVAHIKVAQKRFNIEGGEVPNPELFPLLQRYTKEAELVLRNAKTPPPAWAYEIADYYNIKRSYIFNHEQVSNRMVPGAATAGKEKSNRKRKQRPVWQSKHDGKQS